MKLSFLVVLVGALIAQIFAKDFCQPGDENCWPTLDEIEIFKTSLSPSSVDCLDTFPTFTSKDEPGQLQYNRWYALHFVKVLCNF